MSSQFRPQDVFVLQVEHAGANISKCSCELHTRTGLAYIRRRIHPPLSDRD